MQTCALAGVLLTLAIVTGCARGGPSPQGATTSRVYDLSQRGTLTLDVPSEWQEAFKQTVSGLPPTLEFVPASGAAFHVSIQILSDKDALVDFGTPEKVRAIVNRAGERALAGAVEQELRLEEIRGAQAAGFIYALTSSRQELGSGEFRHLMQGSVVVGKNLLNVTALAQEDAREVIETVRALLTSATWAEPDPSQATLAAGLEIADGRLTNREARYSFDIPEGWEVTQTSTPMLLIVRRNDGQSTLTILTRPSPQDLDAELAQLERALVEGPGRCTVLEKSTATLGGRPVARLVTASHIIEPPLIGRHHVVVDGALAYVFGQESTGGGAEPGEDPDMVRLLESLRFEAPRGAAPPTPAP